MGEGSVAISTGGMDPFLEFELTLKFLEIKNISRERFKSLVYGGVYRFCRTWSIFFNRTFVTSCRYGNEVIL